MKLILALPEIILAILSWLFYKVCKFVIGTLYLIYLQINKKVQKEWRILSPGMLAKPLVMPVLMTKAPRWNTHAIIGTLGPFPVKEKISIDLKAIRNSANAWIFVIYNFPKYETITSISDRDVDADAQWYDLAVSPGRYTIGLRYYQRRDRLQTPAIKLDEQPWATSDAIDPQINDFYGQLIQKRNWFYLALHWYVYPLLKWQEQLPPSFVKGEYLPVGATHTQFFYDAVAQGQSIQIHIDPAIVDQYDIYFNVYDRSSLPLSWCIINQAQFNSPALDVKSTYLLRVRAKNDPGNKVKFQRQPDGVGISLAQIG